jgi:hypothetical protein
MEEIPPAESAAPEGPTPLESVGETESPPLKAEPQVSEPTHAVEPFDVQLPSLTNGSGQTHQPSAQEETAESEDEAEVEKSEEEVAAPDSTEAAEPTPPNSADATAKPQGQQLRRKLRRKPRSRSNKSSANPG